MNLLIMPETLKLSKLQFQIELLSLEEKLIEILKKYTRKRKIILRYIYLFFKTIYYTFIRIKLKIKIINIGITFDIPTNL